MLAWPAQVGGRRACEAPEIRVFKREGVLELRCKGDLRQTMAATFGANPVVPRGEEPAERRLHA